MTNERKNLASLIGAKTYKDFVSLHSLHDILKRLYKNNKFSIIVRVGVNGGVVFTKVTEKALIGIDFEGQYIWLPKEKALSIHISCFDLSKEENSIRFQSEWTKFQRWLKRLG